MEALQRSGGAERDGQNLVSIGKMAQMNHVTIPTLRHYDKLGLLRPAYTDAASGYRYYHIRQNARLDMIAYMKELGMSLSEIAFIFQKEDITLIENILAQKNEQIHEQIRSLKMRHEAVERAILSIERYRKSPRTGTIALEYIDRRYIWAIPCAENFYEKDILSYERVLADLRKALLAHNFPQIHSYNIGTSIRREDFREGRFLADEVFIFADYQQEKLKKNTQVLESGMYACIYADAYEDEAAFAEKLKDFCQRERYEITGAYICEVLTEFNVFDESKRSMFLRLQVPVAFPL